MMPVQTLQRPYPVRVCHAASHLPYVLSVLLGSCLLGGLLPWEALAQAPIVRYQGPDGRLYFTNLPLPPASTPTVVTRPTLATRLATQAPVLPLIQRLAQQYSVD